MMRMNITVRGAKDLSAYSVDELAYYRRSASPIATGIWRRISRGILPDGSRTAPLSKVYKKKKMRAGKVPIRNFYFFGHMQDAMYANITKARGMRFGFSGTVTEFRETRGQQRTTKWRMQQLADRYARVRMNGKLPPPGTKAAPHTFVALNDDDMAWLVEDLRRAAVKSWEKLPLKRRV